MKSSFCLHVVFIFIVLLISTDLSSQCIVENPTANSTCGGCTRVGQTFVVCESGILDSVVINIPANNATSGTFDVRIGPGSIPMTSVLTTDPVGTFDAVAMTASEATVTFD